jgi:hypothetical protein
MNKSNSLVQGIGIKGMKYPTWKYGNHLEEYVLWTNLLKRLTERGFVKNPSYRGATCSENFKSYEFFYEWCQEQVGFLNRDEKGKLWQLDKDILAKGCKHYSEDTCVFVPRRVNNLLTKSNGTRGSNFIGVTWHKGASAYIAQCGHNSKSNKHLGCYHTPEEAFQAYKTFKEALIKEVANEYRTQLDPRAYQTLLNYQVEVTD